MSRIVKITLIVILFCATSFFLLRLLAPVFFAIGLPDPYDVKLDKIIAAELVNDFTNFGKIHEMDDATRCYKSLNFNSISISDFDSYTDSVCTGSNSLDSILKKFNIEKSTYLTFRKRLQSSKLRHYCRDKGMHIFLVDGWLNTNWGYIYSPRQLDVNTTNYSVCNGSYVQITENLGDNWYRFGGR